MTDFQIQNTPHALPLMEAFYTIQGEGAHKGAAAFFIRLAGCDVACPWCDVKASWDETAYPQISIDDICRQIKKTPSHIAVITGGEPLMWNLSTLTEKISHSGFKTHIETSGTHPLTGKWDWICFSPKRYKKPLDVYFEEAHELKIIINHPNDLRWAEKMGKKMQNKNHLFIQAEWSQRKTIYPKMVSFVKAHPHWRISIQTHKYLNIP